MGSPMLALWNLTLSDLERSKSRSLRFWVVDLYGIYIFACGLLPHLNLDVTKENLLAAGFSAVPAVFLVFNSNTWAKSSPLQYIRLCNMSDPEFDLSRSLKVKYNRVVGLPTYDFLLESNNNHRSSSHRLGVIATGKISYLLSLGQKFDTPPHTHTHTNTHPYPGRGLFFQNRMLSPGPEGSPPPKMKLIVWHSP